ncbi:sodium/bile acid cotransporter 7-B-like [Macrosteles quadrilineatus]|uniref:sodium/bile acid cotransporter 7-B-like n=1 Tax=Macrosteles quadrilineatus TaxID=74068 RepID=UPI0023E33406|nr:sodium/bile acid cotransporter 7-B-like [Macrosteles quadrilineatus]XP_054291079.1 sodium/bile acid cotransporter 7-B-like [Macrosteles quadrilineatus]
MAKPKFVDLLKKYWFLFGLLFSIVLADIVPSIGATGGPLKPEWTVKYGAIALIFFISGMTLSFNDLFFAATKVKVHIFILTFTFIFIPTLVLFVNGILRRVFGVNEWILKGLATVSCMPPPVSSAVILTKAVGGSEAAAIFISVVGSFLGIFITPAILLFLLGSTAVVSLFNSVAVLYQTVLFPLCLGQLSRRYGLASLVHRLPLSTVGETALLFIIFTTFCDALKTHDVGMNASDILITVGLVLLLQVALLYITFHLAEFFYTPADVITITFCSTHKSLTLGVPILRILFSGYAHFSQITLPLLVYHPTQIILGGLLVPIFKRWLNRQGTVLP